MQRIVKCPICKAAFWTADDRKEHLEWHKELTKSMTEVLTNLSSVEKKLNPPKKPRPVAAETE